MHSAQRGFKQFHKSLRLVSAEDVLSSCDIHAGNSAAAYCLALQGQHDHDALPRQTMGSKVISTFDISIISSIDSYS